MRSPQEIFELLEQRRAELGLSQAEVSRRALGRNDNSPFQGLRSGSWPSVERLEALAREVGLEFYFGPKRDPAEAALQPGDDFASIPRLEVQLSAGPGSDGAVAAEGSNAVIERLAFRRDWLYRLGIDPARATIVAVRGDSMAPGLQDGDLVLVDGARTTIRPRRVYAFTDVDGQLRVKRLEPFPRSGELVIRSDNADAPLEIRHGDDATRLVIHGEVAWSAHTWRQR